MDGNLDALNESSSQDEDEDSDDNFLYIQPAALQEPSFSSRSKESANETQITHKTDDWEQVESTCSDPCRASKKLKYSLDCIVQTNNIQEQKDSLLTNLHESLRHGIIEGGITKMAEEDNHAEEEDEQEKERVFKPNQGVHKEFGGSTVLESRNVENVPLLPEHEKTLQQYALQHESIATLHPGEDIFCNTDIGKLFTFPIGLSLSEANAMEKLVMTSSADELEEMLMSQIILDMYLGKKCPDAVMLWLLQLMSICDSVLVVGMIFDTMWSLMNSFQNLLPNAKPWCPVLQDITTIFVNYGARLDLLLPPSLFQTNFTTEDISERYSLDKENSEIAGWKIKPNCLPGYNLKQVIKIVTQCLLTHERNPILHEDDLIQLAYIVCKISLDRQLVRCPVQIDIQHCLAAVLNCFQDQTWPVQANNLCRKLVVCSAHHHNLVHLVRLLRTGTQRGKFLCRMLSFTLLERLTKKSTEVEPQCSRDIQACKVSDLIPLLAACKTRSKTDTDYYELHSLITLVELAVGYDKELYQSPDKEALARVVILLRDMAGDIRESHKHLCRTQVKDLMIRIASELTYLEQTLKSKQVSVWQMTS